MLEEPFHVVCTSVEKTFFEHSAAVVHVADDLLQKTRFFENSRFSGNCMAALVTLGAAERAHDGNEDLFQQLLVAIEKVPYIQVLIAPPPPIQTDAYVYQAKKLQAKFPQLYGMTDTGGSLLQIGRYGAHVDRRYVSGDNWDKDGILALKSHLVQVLGHHWLRNTPKASATFPLRQLHQMQLDSSGKAPESQPSTSRRSYDATLHSTRGGRINRHVAAPRSGPRSTNVIDPQLLNNIISALQPSSHPSKPPRQQKRK
ncbi:hypothetical protein AAVH_39377 [Aphelenchoides avenae]|nr:hypothetical protein AAVH_39377 [Aphelenchus avenae]